MLNSVVHEPVLLLPGLLFLIGASFSLICLAFWLWMLVDCLKYEEDANNQKLVWALVIILTNWIGGLIYFFVRRRERKRKEVLDYRRSRRHHQRRVRNLREGDQPETS